MEESTQPQTRHQSQFTQLGLYALIGMFLLVPIFFVPSSFTPLQFSKTLLVALVTVFALVIFLLKTLKDKELRFSWSLLHVAVWLLPFTYLLSSLFSSQPTLSFLGYRLEPDTFGFVLLMAFLTHLTALSLPKKSNIFSALIALLVAAWVVFAFQIVQLIFGAPFPLFSDPVNNLIGRWNDFGVFSGLIGSLVLITLEVLPLPKRHYGVLVVTFFVSLLMLVLTNMTESWILFGLASFVALVLGISRRFLSGDTSPSSRRSTSGVFSFIGFVVTLLFILFGSGLATNVQQSLSINALEVRPSFESTMNVLNASYAADPLFGSGPNTFGSAWLLHRSSEIVQTPFWNVSFNAGSSAVLSGIAVSGIFVAFAWIFFICMMIFLSTRAVLARHAQEPRAYFVVSLSALGMLYLLLVHLLYAPSQVITLLLFLFVGLFLSSIADTPLSRTISVPLKEARIGFAFVLGGVVLTIFAVGSVYSVGSKYLSIYHHNKALFTANQGDFEGGFRSLNSAVRLDPQDRYYRSAALISLAELNRIVQSGDSGEEAQAAFQNALASAVQSVNVAIEKNPHSFQNVMVRGLVFESVVPLGIEGSFENAVSVYEGARLLNPRDPEIDWRLAQMCVLQDDTKVAREFIANALSKKADYTNAILLLAQIELDEGNLDDAIETVRAAVFFEPQNPVLLYQLGILLLQDTNYTEASIAFEEALRLDGSFANASFFLAQAYAFLDRFSEAESLMADLATRNPSNELVQGYREALASNVNPFDSTPVAPNEDEDIVE